MHSQLFVQLLQFLKTLIVLDALKREGLTHFQFLKNNLNNFVILTTSMAVARQVGVTSKNTVSPCLPVK